MTYDEVMEMLNSRAALAVNWTSTKFEPTRNCEHAMATMVSLDMQLAFHERDGDFTVTARAERWQVAGSYTHGNKMHATRVAIAICAANMWHERDRPSIVVATMERELKR